MILLIYKINIIYKVNRFSTTNIRPLHILVINLLKHYTQMLGTIICNIDLQKYPQIFTRITTLISIFLYSIIFILCSYVIHFLKYQQLKQN